MGKLSMSETVWNEITNLDLNKIKIVLPNIVSRGDGLNLLIFKSKQTDDMSAKNIDILQKVCESMFNSVCSKGIKNGTYESFPDNCMLFSIIDGIVEHVSPRTINHQFLFDENTYEEEIEKMISSQNVLGQPMNFYYVIILERENIISIFVKFDVEEHEYIDITRLNPTNVDIKPDWELAKSYDYGETFEVGMDKYFEHRKKIIEEQEKNEQV